MAHFPASRISKAIPSIALLMTFGLVLASCSAPLTSSSSVRAESATIATTAPLPSSLCGSDEGDYVRQSWNGDFTACVRTPNLKGSSFVVALDADLFNTLPSPSTLTTKPTPTTPTAKVVSFTLSPSHVVPGETVVVTGRVSRPLSQLQPLPTLCWDGCDALQEEGAPIHWVTPTSFRMKLKVPATAWIVSGPDSVTIHPLVSGTYEVGIICLTSTFGCDLGPVDAEATITLVAPKPTRCVPGHPCQSMSLSTSNAMVGEEISVKGWAPLQLSIGRPSSYSLSVTPGSTRKKYPSFSFSRISKDGALNVVLTPRIVRIEPGQSWSSLGRVHYVSSTYSGTSSVAPLNDTNLVAWCQPSGIVITGGSSVVTVPTLDVRAALKGSPLSLFFRDPTVPACTTVQLDPRFPASVYAGFDTAQGQDIPPVYLAPLFTTDGGATWHRVPVPPGSSIEDFGGFATEGDEVSALFAGVNNYSGQNSPVGTAGNYVSAEVTSDGGASWKATTLGCPTNGPCTTFGPYLSGYCNMSEQDQPLLVGPSNATAPTRVKWSSSSWIVTVNSCFPQQLVVSSSHELFLLDPSSQYPFLQSTDSGRSWSYRNLPRIAAANYGEDSIPISNSLVLAPNGSLFAAITSESGLTQELFQLKPSATSWCEIPHAFGTTIAASGEVGPLRVNRHDLIWGQTPNSNVGGSTMKLHVEPLADLSC